MEETPVKNPITPPDSSHSSNLSNPSPVSSFDESSPILGDLKPFSLNPPDKVILVLVFAISFLAVFLPDRGFYGLSWDEAYYYKPSREAASWLYRVLLTKDRSLSRENLDASWEEIRELPSVVKILLGSSSLMFEKWLGQLPAFRLPSALAYSLTLVLIYLLIFPSSGRYAALFSVFSYGLMPRIFGHAHIGASESITVFMILLVFYCFIKGLASARWSLLLGIAFGLSLNTKINCVFLPFILLPWAHLFHRKKYMNNFFAMVFLSPLVMIATWPWLWRDTARRVLEYFYFFASHQFTAVYYFGRKYNYGSTLAPWHYPFVMILFTIPSLIQVFMGMGIIASLRSIRTKPLFVLFLWAAFFTLFVSALPASPKYDGIRLFIPAFLFLSLLAGAGISWIMEYAGKCNISSPLKKLIPWLGIALLVGNGILAVGKSRTCPLSYFNIFAGGLPGAYKKGMETTWWGEAVNDDVLKALNELPQGAKVKTLALHDEVFRLLQDWGRLRPDLNINSTNPPYDYHLLLVRKGFFSRPEWCLYLTWPRLKVFEHNSVPLVILFKTGADFEKAWPQIQIPQKAPKS